MPKSDFDPLILMLKLTVKVNELHQNKQHTQPLTYSHNKHLIPTWIKENKEKTYSKFKSIPENNVPERSFEPQGFVLTMYTSFDMKHIIFYVHIFLHLGSRSSRLEQIALYYLPLRNLLLHFLYYQ